MKNRTVGKLLEVHFDALINVFAWPDAIVVNENLIWPFLFGLCTLCILLW